jgi:hypothetical protein
VIDPKRTLVGSKSRSAAVSCRTLVCYALEGSTGGPTAPASIQNDSGLTQGLAGQSVAG